MGMDEYILGGGGWQYIIEFCFRIVLASYEFKRIK